MDAGIVALYKPRGMTSHDCVNRIRRLYKTKKVGHTGTLDPEVDGVLPICIGKATKVAEYMSDFDKTYKGDVTLGFTTTTEDAYGEVVEQRPVLQSVSKSQIEAALTQFQGAIMQTPPYYSAVKVNGKRLYEYARKGIEVDRPTRQVNIHELTLTHVEEAKDDTQRFSFHVRCSKGTYVRTLAVDIGDLLGFPAHMSSLTRTASGSFELANTITFETLENLTLEERYEKLLPFDHALTNFPRRTADRTLEERIKNGAVLANEDQIFGDTRFLFYNEDGECLALYQPHPTKEGLIKPVKLFSQAAGL
ncbi:MULTISPECIES: tRNA pseudouridine(55) synthase TruB [Shouchella]|uniref:tRNA pseudouridine synthase B n=3 Tax=Bacillaceae TaxID=186817 RepID=A0A060LYD5_9BACI|nr:MULTISPECIES: tRNA pseudouridine(55) synthase TruB [Bacillaceae]RQW20638.1 tRNA pseudouridine(55) synthase TruB [Bacillus sp. C1-1]AIC94790.1 tRNA pseudouridine synthase B [Shouchella lehensis G1]KQL58673.1 tRNA pseudouridine synthase B [Alkalicoccobacillus plakortidis]MBG9784350.1 tRNA pseudouridine synthase B [Shouchella lehensis]TES50657.1 tRNA pseudouridine(55) synthase TruB [Shouchella lehensis]